MKPHPPGAIACLVCGVFSVMIWWFPLVAAPLAIIALILGRRAARVREPDAFQPPALATAGQLCAVLALAAMLTVTVALMALLSFLGALVPAAGAPPPGPPHVPVL